MVTISVIMGSPGHICVCASPGTLLDKGYFEDAVFGNPSYQSEYNVDCKSNLV